MKVKESENNTKWGHVKVNPDLDKLDSGRIGAEKMAKLKKHKGAIAASENKNKS